MLPTAAGGAKWSAPAGQAATHRGSAPARSLSGQRSHFATWSRVRSLSSTPNGQARTQEPQPRQKTRLRVTAPFSSRRRASNGQAATHGGSSQWRHTAGTRALGASPKPNAGIHRCP